MKANAESKQVKTEQEVCPPKVEADDNQAAIQQSGPAKQTFSRRDVLIGAVAGSAAIGAASRGLFNGQSAALAANANTHHPVSQNANPNVLDAEGDPPLVYPTGADQETLKTYQENWGEPMVWNVGDWPGQQLDLNAVYHSAPFDVLGFNPSSGPDLIFSYNGIAPGPTIRMRDDETFYLKLRNMLPLNAGVTEVPIVQIEEGSTTGTKEVNNWCLGEHLNGVHSTHTTNIHTHGLHVRAGRNPDGTHSDNIYLRVMPQADWEARRKSDDPFCNFIKHNELVAQADYEFRLGDVGADFLKENPEIAAKLGHKADAAPYPHPDGTFWYHPHSHGSTYMQVSGGMAGFLLVEGTTDDAIRRALNVPQGSDPELPAGDYNFRERLMLIQRIKNTPGADPDAPKLGNRAVNNTAFKTLLNGSGHRLNIVMSPGSVERWRVLNGGVDSFGWVQMYVLKGDWQTINDSSPYNGQLTIDGTNPVTDEELAPHAVDYKLLAFDGVTLVNDPKHPYDNPITGDSTEMDQVRYTFQDIDVANGDAPALLSVANRADILFRAPELTEAEANEDDVYTVVARHWGYVSDRIALDRAKDPTKGPYPADTVIARLIVREPSEGEIGQSDTDPFQLIFDELAPDKTPVQPYLHPVLDEELKLTEEEMKYRFMPGGEQLTGDWYRKRLVTYSGWGGGYPAKGNNSLVRADLQGKDQYPVVAPKNTSTGDTMAIDGFKFNPDLIMHTMNLDTAEEWVLQNCSMRLYGKIGKTDIDPRVWGPLPDDMEFADKEQFGALDADGNLLYPVSAAVDHPFHIHQNPMWVTEHWTVSAVDNETGEVTLAKDEKWIPRWQDVIHIPRDGGRIVARSRFWDFVGSYVNHCHLLLHEDNGMMQQIKVINEAGDISIVKERGQITYKADGSIKTMQGNLANYSVVPLDGLTDTEANQDKQEWRSSETDIWPKVKDRRECFLQSQTAVDTDQIPANPACIAIPGTVVLQSQGFGQVDKYCAINLVEEN